MIRALFVAVLLLLSSNVKAQSEEGPFRQVSDHCYVLQIYESGENIAVVVSSEGVLLFDPPPDPDLSILVESLKTITDKPVRWMLQTGFSPFRPSGVDYFARQGAVLLAGFRQSTGPVASQEPSPLPFRLREPEGFVQRGDEAVDHSGPARSVQMLPGPSGDETSPVPEIIFKKDLFLFPDNLEIRINELDREARTRADIFAYVPEEKVLFTGRLFQPFYYPDVNVMSEGSALKWIDGLQQMVDSVPLLISAIPPERPDEEKENDERDGEVGTMGGEEGEAEEEEEPTLEEMVAVISSRGEVSNLQELKDTLEAAKALRNGISRSIKAGRSCERYLNSSSTNQYRVYGNFSSFTEQICRELSTENNKKE
jgi:hypothetical protein